MLFSFFIPQLTSAFLPVGSVPWDLLRRFCFAEYRNFADCRHFPKSPERFDVSFWEKPSLKPGFPFWRTCPIPQGVLSLFSQILPCRSYTFRLCFLVLPAGGFSAENLFREHCFRPKSLSEVVGKNPMNSRGKADILRENAKHKRGTR